LTEKPKPTRGHFACITELGLRFPKARDDDPQSYALRMDYLAKDLAHLAVPLLRAACDRAAQSARGMPYAAEIIDCAKAIIEDRQRVAGPVNDARNSTVDRNIGKLAGLAREYNLDNQRKGSPMRWTDAMQLFRIGDPGERRWTNANGEVVA
jgi:hypothetical protein